jgi:hypothetical protein
MGEQRPRGSRVLVGQCDRSDIFVSPGEQVCQPFLPSPFRSADWIAERAPWISSVRK